MREPSVGPPLVRVCLYFHIQYIYFPCSWNDLIVGAPFYFDRMKDQGGAVYVFMNENGSFEKTATVVLKGPSASGFGLAVAAIGDVNQDGFQGTILNAAFALQKWNGQNKANICGPPLGSLIITAT